ncbi:MAG: hypothetical protein JWO99_153 [Candidatus Saccharibacteria bacterium]|nr:hypothetical protein [Candidatus Saccharibacteria bacterium]
MYMNNFDNDPTRTEKLHTPESYESKSHVILREPTEIDIEQADRAPDVSFEEVTGFVESKLIGEIVTPDDHIGIIRTDFPDMQAFITLVGRDRESVTILNPGEEAAIDVSAGKGKCIVYLDETGTRLFVRAEDPDSAYKIFTRVLEEYKVIEDFSSDDPEY